MARRAPRPKSNGHAGAAPVTVSEAGNDPNQAPANGAGHNSSAFDEDLKAWCRKAASAKEDLRTEKIEVDAAMVKHRAANGFYRKILKDAKKAGHDPDLIVWYLENKDRKPDEIDKETRARTRIARLMEMPIGTQLGMFEDGTTVATAIESGTNPDAGLIDKDDLDSCEELGFRAGKAGKPGEAPYPEGDPREIRWSEGWKKGTADNVAGLNGGAPAAEGATAH
jgi:ribosome modulation factor